MNKKIKILCTLGPSSMKPGIIKKLDEKGVDIFRINLSHTPEDAIEGAVSAIRAATGKPICIDTEGAQIRNGLMAKKTVKFKNNSIVRIHRTEAVGDSANIYLKPGFISGELKPGDLISVDFENLLLKVLKKYKKVLKARVMCAGRIGSNKAVTIDREIKLPALSKKDMKAIRIGLRYGVEYVALSFAGGKEDVKQLRGLVRDKMRIISKIESKKGLDNLDDILSVSDSILIDRGDLAREEALEMIPFFQKAIIRRAKEHDTPVYIATNLLESMVNRRVPTRAEVNDVVNTLLDGADGLVLAAETAIGKYPVECLTMVRRIITTYETVPKSHSRDYIPDKRPPYSLTLTEPHGGYLVDRTNFGKNDIGTKGLKMLPVDERVIIDAEQIATGAYSPITGFMKKGEIERVLNEYKLSDTVIWTLPIVLQAAWSQAKNFRSGDKIALVYKKDGNIYAILDLEDIYRFDFKSVALRWYGTVDLSHPGVKMLKAGGDCFLGGKIELLRRIDNNFREFTLTPVQTRHIFEKKGWNTIAAFHTRNVIHRAHEHLQISTLKKFGVDGLFLHPVIGPKKKFDFTAEAILRSYSIMLEKYYPKDKVLLAAFLAFSRYGGPREAVFTALCRKNFGCTHFIVGRDHTGIGKFYEPDGARKLFDKLGDIGIKPIFFDEVYYCKICKKYVENCRHGRSMSLQISGSAARDIFKSGKIPPEWFMRKDIAKSVIDSLKNKKRVFVR